MTHSSTMIDGDDRNAVVLPPLTPALLLNKAALLNAHEGICSLAVFFKVDDLGKQHRRNRCSWLGRPLHAARGTCPAYFLGPWPLQTARDQPSQRCRVSINDALGDDWQAAIGIDGELSIDVTSRTVLILGLSPATGELSFCRVF